MSENPHAESHNIDDNIDDDLAAYTDRLLSGEGSGEVEVLAPDDELRGLQETVERLWKVLGPEQPDEAMAERIHDSLTAEWRAAGLEDQVATPLGRRWPWLSRALDGLALGKPQMGYALAGVAAVVLLLGLALCLTPSADEALPGAALSETNFALFALVVGGVLGGIAWWFVRRR